MPLALYIHIPFCAVRCAYCDFNTYAGLERLHEPFVAALVEEICRAGAVRGRPPVRTIFVGGGTPTVLPPELLARALDACRRAFDIAPDAEITCEANPGTVDQARFGTLRAMGVNRLSMGVQSFDDAELHWLGRMHTAEEAVVAFHAARRAGFDNINLDFIFGLPGQTFDTWARTLTQAIALGPEHLSLYSLTVEHGTPLYDRVRRGLADAPDDDLAAELYELACRILETAGYEQYEISNWARRMSESTNLEHPVCHSRHEIRDSLFEIRHSPFACRHNLVYWHHEPYLGFGPGAHSFDGARRWWNVKPVPEYIGRMAAGRSPERGGEIIDRRTAMGEFMMLGLRLVREGVTDERFRGRFGVGMDEVFGEPIARLVAQELLERLPDRLRLTPRGRLLGNRVFGEFL
ncbi:MAG: radical SAM family heme chaperone HemW [Anaerolineae bacterium]|nr:radical SAM family heme chaperone HemW [Anaerolineae bacterium]